MFKVKALIDFIVASICVAVVTQNDSVSVWISERAVNEFTLVFWLFLPLSLGFVVIEAISLFNSGREAVWHRVRQSFGELFWAYFVTNTVVFGLTDFGLLTYTSNPTVGVPLKLGVIVIGIGLGSNLLLDLKTRAQSGG